MRADDVTCPNCRRSVTPISGPLGKACPRCHGLLPHAPRGDAKPPARRVSEEEPVGPVMARVANELLAEARENVTSVRQLADLTETAGLYVAAAYNVDAETARTAAKSRERGRLWRQALPDLAEELSVG